MIKRIFGDMPDWAQRANPLLRYELVRREGTSSAVGRIAMWVIFLATLIVAGYIHATDGMQRGLQLPYTLDIWRVIVFPLFFVQLIMRVAGLSMGVGAVTDERQRQTWDNLRATENGAAISLRTRWVSVFYRLKGLAFTILAARLILIAAILYELTSMQGAYLDLLSARALPMVSAEVGIIILSAFMTAFIMLPFTATGVDIALGLLISTTIRNRAIAALLQVILVVFRVGVGGVCFWLSWQLVNDNLMLEGVPALSLLGAGAIFGDWGIILSQLSTTGQLWSEIPFSIFLGLILLFVAIVQVAVTSGILQLAVRAAEVRE
ncbi:MAG: hypothetical protein WBC91_06130 [Phototrophicaceae bacterium]